MGFIRRISFFFFLFWDSMLRLCDVGIWHKSQQTCYVGLWSRGRENSPILIFHDQFRSTQPKNVRFLYIAVWLTSKTPKKRREKLYYNTAFIMSIKDFKVLETIGKGSFASVYKVCLMCVGCQDYDLILILTRLFENPMEKYMLWRE